MCCGHGTRESSGKIRVWTACLKVRLSSRMKRQIVSGILDFASVRSHELVGCNTWLPSWKRAILALSNFIPKGDRFLSDLSLFLARNGLQQSRQELLPPQG